MTTQTTTPKIPDILTANTYFWRSGSNAASRRNNEARRHAEFNNFMSAHGRTLEEAGITIEFDYSESCNNVYKHVRVFRNGKRSNITAVRKALGI